MRHYKLKRMRECWATDGSTKSLHLEGSERMRGKKEVAEGLDEFLSYNDKMLREMKSNGKRRWLKLTNVI